MLTRLTRGLQTWCLPDICVQEGLKVLQETHQFKCYETLHNAVCHHKLDSLILILSAESLLTSHISIQARGAAHTGRLEGAAAGWHGVQVL